MNWISILVLLVKVASIIAGYLNDKRALDAAAKQNLADELSKLVQKMGIAKDVEDRISKLSDSDVDKRLSERGDFRD